MTDLAKLDSLPKTSDIGTEIAQVKSEVSPLGHKSSELC